MPIYTIRQSNIDTVLPQLQIGADVKSDIANAVNAGKQVTVSKSNINLNGWTGCGYIITDPLTGAGAYMISGGQNGAFLVMLAGLLLLILGLVLAPTGVGIAIAILGALLISLAIYTIFSSPSTTNNNCFFGHVIQTVLIRYWDNP